MTLAGVILVGVLTRMNVRADHWLKANQAESTYLQSKLDKFYGPFKIISDTNHLLARDLASRQKEPGDYRLLDKLFDNKWRDNLSPGDLRFVEEICNNAMHLTTIIEKNIGWIDVELQPFLSRALAHFRVLHLAYEKKLGSSSTPYLKYVYPIMLDRVLDEEIQRIRDRLNLLRSNPTKRHAVLCPMDLKSQEMELQAWPDPPRPIYDPDSNSLVAVNDEVEGSG